MRILIDRLSGLAPANRFASGAGSFGPEGHGLCGCVPAPLRHRNKCAHIVDPYADVLSLRRIPAVYTMTFKARCAIPELRDKPVAPGHHPVARNTLGDLG